MPTSKPPRNSIRTEIASFGPPVDTWLDLRMCLLVVEMADGHRIKVALTPCEFEKMRAGGFRVYDSERRE